MIFEVRALQKSPKIFKKHFPTRAVKNMLKKCDLHHFVRYIMDFLGALLYGIAERQQKSDKNSIEILHEGTVAGVESVMYRKGDDDLSYFRNFEYYSQTHKVDAPNEELIDIINNSIENDDYSSFVDGFSDVSEFSHSDNYEYDNYDLDFCSMDDDEIPEEILDEDGGIDVLKLEDNGWSFEIMDEEAEFDESEITEISISVDDKQFTFKSH